jgi:hypothetical protein
MSLIDFGLCRLIMWIKLERKAHWLFTHAQLDGFWWSVCEVPSICTQTLDMEYVSNITSMCFGTMVCIPLFAPHSYVDIVHYVCLLEWWALNIWLLLPWTFRFGFHACWWTCVLKIVEVTSDFFYVMSRMRKLLHHWVSIWVALFCDLVTLTWWRDGALVSWAALKPFLQFRTFNFIKVGQATNKIVVPRLLSLNCVRWIKALYHFPQSVSCQRSSCMVLGLLRGPRTIQSCHMAPPHLHIIVMIYTSFL